jgi:hypothetical protein
MTIAVSQETVTTGNRPPSPNAAKYDERSVCSRGLADAIPTQRISDVYADADVAGLDRVFMDRLQYFVEEQRCSVTGRGGGVEHVLPAWRNDGGPKDTSPGLTR